MAILTSRNCKQRKWRISFFIYFLSTFSRFLVFHFGEHWIRLLRFENNFDLFGDLNVNSGSFVVNFGLLED
jgi:hypothetical protein